MADYKIPRKRSPRKKLTPNEVGLSLKRADDTITPNGNWAGSSDATLLEWSPTLRSVVWKMAMFVEPAWRRHLASLEFEPDQQLMMRRGWSEVFTQEQLDLLHTKLSKREEAAKRGERKFLKPIRILLAAQCIMDELNMGQMASILFHNATVTHEVAHGRTRAFLKDNADAINARLRSEILRLENLPK